MFPSNEISINTVLFDLPFFGNGIAIFIFINGDFDDGLFDIGEAGGGVRPDKNGVRETSTPTHVLNRVGGVFKEAIGFAVTELPDHFWLEGLAAVIGVWCKGHDENLSGLGYRTAFSTLLKMASWRSVKKSMTPIPILKGLVLLTIACHAAAASVFERGQLAFSWPLFGPRDTSAALMASMQMFFISVDVMMMAFQVWVIAAMPGQ
jgi:hypothetical protein